jgi:hypothetical protein
MNKRYASILALVTIGGAAMAQSTERQARVPYSALVRGHVHTPPANPDRVVIWQNDFSTPADWVISNETGAFPDVEWQIGTGLESTGPYGTPAIASTTAANGYAMLCSDCGNNQGGDYEKSYLTTAAPIDMSAYPHAILEFETQYRRFNNEQTYVAISLDGVNWPQPPSDTATVDLPDGLYPVWRDGELEQGVSPGNPTVKRINISCYAGGQPTVWVRFYWYGVWGYAWYVDDITLSETSTVDMAMFSGYMSHTGTGDEFGRIPENQVGTTMHVGGTVANIGLDDLTNVTVTVNVVDGGGNPAFSHTTAAVDIAADACGFSTSFLDEPVTIPALTPGVYTATYTISSDQGGSDANLDNNTVVRVFEVTSSTGVYSLDGVDVYPEADVVVSSTGTSSFTDNADGIFCMTNYYVLEPTTVYGLWVGVTSTSVPDARIIASLHDTTNVMRPNADVTQPFVTSADHFLTQDEIDAGFVIIPFSDSYEMTSDIVYLAAVELYSEANGSDVRILDDVTIPQPGFSSLIWLPNDDPNNFFTYSNGNAFVIRLLLDPSIGMEERAELEGVNVFPNPTSGLVNINFTVPGAYTVELINGLGETVITHRLNGNSLVDLSDLAKGVYSVRISNKEKTTVQRVSLN